MEQKVISLEHRGTQQGDKGLDQTRKGSRFFRGLDGALLLVSLQSRSPPLCTPCPNAASTASFEDKFSVNTLHNGGMRPSEVEAQ